jgi:ATP/ADP translocase
MHRHFGSFREMIVSGPCTSNIARTVQYENKNKNAELQLNKITHSFITTSIIYLFVLTVLNKDISTSQRFYQKRK